MKSQTIHIDEYRNETNGFQLLFGLLRVGGGVEIFKADIDGPFATNRDSQIGPDVCIGRYTSFNKSCFIARSQMGSFCSIGARVSINPFNHPVDWLSIHEFQYHPRSFDWVEEYREFDRLERDERMFERCAVGNDVWCGHHVHIMPGVTVGDGAVIAAGAVVTKDVSPYAVVAGMPAKTIRYRFDERTIDRLLAVRWWDMELSRLSGMPFREPIKCLAQLEDIRAEIDASGIQAGGKGGAG